MSRQPDVFASDQGETWSLAFEIGFLLGLVRLAGNDLDKELQPSDEAAPGDRSHHAERIWLSIQGLIVTAASIGRLLWPVLDPTGAASRLRTAMGPVAVLQDRRVRNALEHLDETFHKNLGRPPGGDVWQLHWSDPDEPELEEPIDRIPYRALDVRTSNLEIRRHGHVERLNLRELRLELDTLASNLAEAQEMHKRRLRRNASRLGRGVGPH
jgi:hypothetical protein